MKKRLFCLILALTMLLGLLPTGALAGDIALGCSIMPADDVNSVLVVESNTPPVVVGGLKGEPEPKKAAGFIDVAEDAYYAKAGDYAVPALKWAVEQKILTGQGNSILDPRGKATRAEVAAMLTRYCNQ